MFLAHFCAFFLFLLDIVFDVLSTAVVCVLSSCFLFLFFFATNVSLVGDVSGVENNPGELKEVPIAERNGNDIGVPKGCMLVEVCTPAALAFFRALFLAGFKGLPPEDPGDELKPMGDCFVVAIECIMGNDRGVPKVVFSPSAFFLPLLLPALVTGVLIPEEATCPGKTGNRDTAGTEGTENGVALPRGSPGHGTGGPMGPVIAQEVSPKSFVPFFPLLGVSVVDGNVEGKRIGCTVEGKEVVNVGSPGVNVEAVDAKPNVVFTNCFQEPAFFPLPLLAISF